MKEEFENNTSILKFESHSDENLENAKKKSKQKINIPDLRQKLKKINENEEKNYSTNITNLPSKDFIEDDQSQSQELITTLKNKIEELELKIIDLKDKNEELKKIIYCFKKRCHLLGREEILILGVKRVSKKLK